MPLLVRGMQNNFKSSVDGIEIERDGESIFFVWYEGGVSYRLEIGFYDFKENVIDLRGEKYLVRVMGEAMEDEDRNMLYKIELLFPEMPNTRHIKLSFGDEDRLIMRMSELPNEKIASVLMSEMNGTNPKLSFFMDLVEKRVGKNFTSKRLTEVFAPRLTGARVGAENYTAIMDEEREKLKAIDKTSKVVDTLIDKLLRDNEDEYDTEKGFITEIFDRIKMKIPAPKPKNKSLKKPE